MKATEAQAMAISGPNLAAQAFRAGLVNVCHVFLAPVTVGDGKHSFPKELRLDLQLQDERRFGSGMVYLQYRSAKGKPPNNSIEPLRFPTASTDRQGRDASLSLRGSSTDPAARRWF